jgi:hypothetical protein
LLRVQLLGTLSEADEFARAGTALAQAGGESVDALRRRIQERLRQAAAGAPKGGSGKGRKEARAQIAPIAPPAACSPTRDVAWNLETSACAQLDGR